MTECHTCNVRVDAITQMNRREFCFFVLAQYTKRRVSLSNKSQFSSLARGEATTIYAKNTFAYTFEPKIWDSEIFLMIHIQNVCRF